MTREKLLEQLIKNEKPIELLVSELGKFGWDSEVELVTLKVVDIHRLLSCYLKDEITALDVEQWANAVESRDDIAYEKVSRDLIKDVIYELANPDLTEKLSKKRVEEICIDLAKYE